MSDAGGIEKIDLEKIDWRGSREFFESLGEALDKLDDKDESYDFTWVGKRKAIIEAGAPINKAFRPDVEASKDWDTTENLFIEGDNLDALKLLQESYLGKVKMIYIDPPYNTGKDFVYHDDFKASVKNYDEDTEYKDGEGNIQFKKNEKTNGRYHSDWLSMMYPRLKLARNLLSDDGVIFISIDDNEQANLKKLCDEVFGEDNFIDNIIWKKRYGGGAKERYLVSVHEYVLVYARDKESIATLEVATSEAQAKQYYTSKDEYFATKGPYRTHPLEAGKAMDSRPNLVYDITAPDGSLIKPRRQWLWSKDRVTSATISGELEFKKSKDGQWSVASKQYLHDKDGNIRKTKALSLVDDIYTQHGTNETVSLMGNAKIFSYPKPSAFVERLIKIADRDKDALVVDFFSGSATTAHAVTNLNAKDGGNRKWIMVQLPEKTYEIKDGKEKAIRGSEAAFEAGYRTIPEIARERIRRAGDKIAGEYPDTKVDYGFRALRIDETNHKDVYRPAADYQQSMLDELVDNVKEDRSDLDLLYGVLTATAWELNKPLETIELDSATVYKYDYLGEVSGLVACFASQISEETIKQIAQLKPLTAVFREGSFPDSQAKVNLAEHFRILSSETKVKVI